MANKTSGQAKGMAEVIKNLNREIEKMGGATDAGMRRGVQMLQRKAEQGTPVDTGTLRNSGYSQTTKTPSGTTGRLGFTAKYSLIVHELPTTRTGRPRFLLLAISENVQKFLSILARAARVK